MFGLLDPTGLKSSFLDPTGGEPSALRRLRALARLGSQGAALMSGGQSLAPFGTLGLPAPTEPPPVSGADFSLKPYEMPYAGLHNAPYAPGPRLPQLQPPGPQPAALPPFQMPADHLLPMASYMDPGRPPPPVTRADFPSMPQPSMPPMQPVQPQVAVQLPAAGGQGWGGVEPAPAAAPAYDPNLDPRYLPEQWRGAFTRNWWER